MGHAWVNAGTPRCERWARSMLVSWLALSAVGCGGGDDDGATLGELGRVGFTYQRSCFFGCSIEQPLLTGARETIALTKQGDEAGLTAVSSSRKIAEVAVERACYCERDDGHGGKIDIAEHGTCDLPFDKHCDNTVLVQANGAGDASLELRDAHGEAIDRVTVRVRDADSAEFFGTYAGELGQKHATRFELEVGDALDLEVDFYDDQARKLLAPEGVHWRSDRPSVADLSAWLIGSGAELDAGLSVVVTGHAVGEVKIFVEVPGLEASVTVTVSDAP